MKYSLTITIIAFAISIILGVFLLFPQYQDYKKTKTGLEQAKIDFANRDHYVQQLRETGKKIEENQEIIVKLNEALPSHRDIPSFINFLKELSKSNGVSLDDIKWDSVQIGEKRRKQDENKKDFNTYSVHMSASGSYFAFKNFLFGLENSGRLIDIKKAHFAVSKTPDKLSSFDITMDIHSY